jgi:hypothetical protein
MNGFMKKGFAGLLMAGVLSSMGCWGGEHYRNLVDPCWPERYEAQARQEVIQAFTPQVMNGRILDQTIWNYHFEPGKPELHPGGKDKLDQLIQTRPQPDGVIYLATARDIELKRDADGKVEDDPSKFADLRRDLNTRRIISIQRYIAAQTADRPVDFEIRIHDPAPVNIASVSASRAISIQRFNYFGTLGSGAAGAGAIPGGGVGGISATGQPQSQGQPQPQQGQPGYMPPGSAPMPPR